MNYMHSPKRRVRGLLWRSFHLLVSFYREQGEIERQRKNELAEMAFANLLALTILPFAFGCDLDSVLVQGLGAIE